jgi:hypothetical protein
MHFTLMGFSHFHNIKEKIFFFLLFLKKFNTKDFGEILFYEYGYGAIYFHCSARVEIFIERENLKIITKVLFKEN